MTALLLLLAIALLSLIAFGVYAYDKLAAKLNRRRIPEAVLLTLSLLGGAPGGLTAMLTLRHKTRKPAFWLTNLAACALHALLLLAALLRG